MAEYYAIPGGGRPYSEAVKAGNTLYVSGQVGIDKETGTFPAEIEKQIALVLDNLKGVLERHGYTVDDIVKVSVLLTDIADAPVFNELYVKAFPNHLPARTLTGIRLVGEAKLELDAIAYKD